jgi:hypothetical protein
MPIPLSVKISMLVAFIVVMSGFAWFWHKVVYDWLPDSILAYGAVAIVFLLVGFFLGEYSERRHIRKGRDESTSDWE